MNELIVANLVRRRDLRREQRRAKAKSVALYSAAIFSVGAAVAAPLLVDVDALGGEPVNIVAAGEGYVVSAVDAREACERGNVRMVSAVAEVKYTVQMVAMSCGEGGASFGVNFDDLRRVNASQVLVIDGSEAEALAPESGVIIRDGAVYWPDRPSALKYMRPTMSGGATMNVVGGDAEWSFSGAQGECSVKESNFRRTCAQSDGVGTRVVDGGFVQAGYGRQ